MKTITESARLVLRTLTTEDAPFYHRLVNDPSFIQNIGDRGERKLEEARASMEQRLMGMQAERGHSLYLVQRKEDGVPIGLCGLIKRDTLDEVDLGYAYLPPYWGKGYAVEAGGAVLDHAWRDLRLPRVLAITNPGNAGSIAVLTRLGFSFDRLAHLTPEDPGTNVYFLDSPQNRGQVSTPPES